MCRSEFPLTNQILHEFIDSKRDLLFRPLDPDEMPVSEVKGSQRNIEGSILDARDILLSFLKIPSPVCVQNSNTCFDLDHYGMMPSLDHFLRVDPSEIKHYFYQVFV